MTPQDKLDEAEELFYIATCQICTLAPVMRHCFNGCKFNIGLEGKVLQPFPHDYWICNCREMRHSSVLVCAFCHTDQPERVKNYV